MILTPHLLLGAAIASKIPNIYLAAFLSFTSHYLLDLIPHVEYSVENIKNKRWHRALPDFTKVFIDFSFSVLLILLLSDGQLNILIIALFSIVPDGFELLRLFFSNKLSDTRNNMHQKVHFLKDKKISNFWRVLSQILIVVISIFLLRV